MIFCTRKSIYCYTYITKSKTKRAREQRYRTLRILFSLRAKTKGIHSLTQRLCHYTQFNTQYTLLTFKFKLLTGK